MVGERQCGWCKVRGSELGERKAAMLQRGGNTFHGERKERERERGVERVQHWVRTRRKVLRPQTGELGELSGSGFLL